MRILQCEKRKKIWDGNVDNIVLSKLVERKTNSKYFIEYLDKVIRSLVLILPKMSEYVNNVLMSFRVDNSELLEIYGTIWTKIEDLKSILN